MTECSIFAEHRSAGPGLSLPASERSDFVPWTMDPILTTPVVAVHTATSAPKYGVNEYCNWPTFRIPRPNECALLGMLIRMDNRDPDQRTRIAHFLARHSSERTAFNRTVRPRCPIGDTDKSPWNLSCGICDFESRQNRRTVGQSVYPRCCSTIRREWLRLSYKLEAMASRATPRAKTRAPVGTLTGEGEVLE